MPKLRRNADVFVFPDQTRIRSAIASALVTGSCSYILARPCNTKRSSFALGRPGGLLVLVEKSGEQDGRGREEDTMVRSVTAMTETKPAAAHTKAQC